MDRLIAPPSGDFNNLDLEHLRSLAENRVVEELPSDEWDRFVFRNLQFLFYNRLNRSRLLVWPAPQKVADRVAHILGLTNRLDSLLAETRQTMVAGGEGHSRFPTIVRDVKKTGEELKAKFEDYFVDLAGDAYVLRIPVGSSTEFGFIHFLREFQKIKRRLDERVRAYFLSTQPGTVSLDDYSSYSVSVLCDSLVLLADKTAEIIDG